MARPTNTDRRREEIVEAMLQVMAEEGYERASVGRVARKAGLTPGLLHYHFESKEAVLLALVERLLEGVRRRVAARLEHAGDDPRERLAAYLDGMLDTGPDADAAAVACWARIATEAIGNPAVRSPWERWMGVARRDLESVLRDACRREGLSARGVAAMAAALLATVEGYFVFGAAAPALVPRGSAAAMARRMAGGLLDAQPRKDAR